MRQLRGGGCQSASRGIGSRSAVASFLAARASRTDGQLAYLRAGSVGSGKLTQRRGRDFRGTVLTLLLFASFVCRADTLKVQPTTTVSAQTSNNTSAANDFAVQSNGNLGATNVSKTNVHSLLYAGARTKIYAHLVLWFGKPQHIDIGYSSTDPAQVKRQIDDMISRGIDGVMMVWYGPTDRTDIAAQAVMHEAEKHHGFTFALMVDQGAIKWDSCSGCTPQQALTQQLQYIEKTYFSSPAYLKWNGQPVVTNFDIDRSFSINWDALSSALPTKPAFLFQNSSGFTHAVSRGAYSWIMPTMADYGLDYLTGFYQTGMRFPSVQTWGAAYKGFNDTLASWSANRIMEQQCGQTWLQTFSQINHLYSQSNQLTSMQLVTWNDYEEGTEIESGIDNCLSVSAGISGSKLQWSVSGNENTIDHYLAYISTDGKNLMPLGQQPVSKHSLDLCDYSLAPGDYRLFVQAVGKPSVMNHLSSAESYEPHCSGSADGISLTVNPSALTVSHGKPGSFKVVVAPQSGSFDQSVSLSCPDLPTGMTCAFSPAAVTPGSKNATSSLVISTSQDFALNRPPQSGHRSRLLLAVWLLGFPLAGLVSVREMKALVRAVGFAVLIALLVTVASCGGATSLSSNQVDSPAAYTITISGNSGETTASTVASVTVQ